MYKMFEDCKSFDVDVDLLNEGECETYNENESVCTKGFINI